MKVTDEMVRVWRDLIRMANVGQKVIVIEARTLEALLDERQQARRQGWEAAIEAAAKVANEMPNRGSADQMHMQDTIERAIRALRMPEPESPAKS